MDGKGNGKVVIGENSNNPLHSNSKIKTHAEMDALEKVKSLIRCRKIKKNKMNLIVLRVNKIGELCESAPCFHCTKELSENNLIQIDKLYYSTAGGYIVCIKFNEWVKLGISDMSKGWKLLQNKNKK